ncbi:MAG TPA: preprotein translocase subunit SecG [Steroidobacteraceae bacterium]|jgi:preprotein translocase subunit SecG
MLHTFLMIIHFFCAAAIVALVLLQRGKGAEAGAGFGAGASGTVFGARGASTALSRATAILAAVFMITSLSLAYVGARRSSAPANSLLDQLPTPAAPASTVPRILGGGGGASSGGADAAGAASAAPAATSTPASGAENGATGSAPSAPSPASPK